MYTFEMVQRSISLLNSARDGSNANQQARDKAAKILLNAASSFRNFAASNPKTNLASYLGSRAAVFEVIALTA